MVKDTLAGDLVSHHGDKHVQRSLYDRQPLHCVLAFAKEDLIPKRYGT